jgi:hypothetical protein
MRCSGETVSGVGKNLELSLLCQLTTYLHTLSSLVQGWISDLAEHNMCALFEL